MEKGKIIIIGCGRDLMHEKSIFELLVNQKQDPIFIATPARITDPLWNQKTKPEDLVNTKIDWEEIKDRRFNAEVPMKAIEYVNLVYNEPKSKIHK